MTTDERFSILVVCHANLCRSPLAEGLARQSLGPAAGVVEVSSAGTHAWSNQPMHPYAEQVLGEYAVDTAGFRTRRLGELQVRTADLILTATRQQRSACVALDAVAVRRTFTIPQFGRYLQATPPDALPGIETAPRRLRRLLDLLPVVRASVPVGLPADDDLADPVDQPVEAFRRCAAQLLAVFGALNGLIAPIPPAALTRHRLPARPGRP
ncbi:protein-tyrosine-phosphatase [Winogradskya consettensis]|uniref:protein-tyrosine-phosphatase n=1 Tax=Winogradskya consettensis TaxID=113560 RepID=A0A919SE40_9ACTN|nr:low molecular weight phosphatase family protein [Actinoplanes consettensis]GIM70156.1 protein-tyrosine-phosphatase [Actinoplanes consettensis]